jgi:cell division protein FtsN
MFVRALFMLLFALNVGGACWLAFANKPAAEAPNATDAGVPRLELLAERDAGDADHAELASAPESPADLANDQCRSFGPFPTQADTRAAMNVLTPLTKRIRMREEHATQTRGYWVYVPAMATRDQALTAARSLSAKGVHDYYVVTAGDQQNTISLGLFRDQGNAERRRAEIAALGFTPKVNTRTEDLPVYWLDFALAGVEPADLASRVPGAREAHMETSRCY